MSKITIQTDSNNNKQINNNVQNIHFGIVISNDDPDNINRLKIRIDGLDNNIDDSDLPWSLPLIPRFFHMIPKIGEAVRVLISNEKKPYNLRTWVGSIISQPQSIDFDPYYFSALTGTDYQTVKPLESINNIIDGKEIYPTKDDVGIVGRYNTDILQRKKEVLIRAGIHEDNNKLKLNRKNPNYIKLNFNNDISTTMIVADRIGIMTHKGTKKFNTILKEDDIEKFFNDANSLPKGEVLVQALIILRDALISHVHGGTNIPANNSKIIQDLKSIDFNKILSTNIKIN